jgi:hypothetical protein
VYNFRSHHRILIYPSSLLQSCWASIYIISLLPDVGRCSALADPQLQSSSAWKSGCFGHSIRGCSVNFLPAGDLLYSRPPWSSSLIFSSSHHVDPSARRLLRSCRGLRIPHIGHRYVLTRDRAEEQKLAACLFCYCMENIGLELTPFCAASGLYYLSELVEEHTVLARRLLTRLIYSVIVVQVLLWLFDRFPLSLSLLSIVSHLIYACNLRRFPVVKLSDPFFILSCVLVCINHWLWFRHFSKPAVPRSSGSWRQPYQPEYESMPTFTEVASYFGLCVWLVPFALFVSLSAGDNILPSMGSEYATGDHSSSGRTNRDSISSDGKSKNKGMAKALVDGARDWVGETGELMGFWRGEQTRRF